MNTDKTPAGTNNANMQIIRSKNLNALPISVIIPAQEKRMEFMHQYTLPLLQANNPIEIIINKDLGNAAKKRNQAFEQATQPFVMFLDDDKLLPKDYIKTLHNSLIISGADFVYTGYTGVVLYPNTHPCKTNYRVRTRDFDIRVLKNANYIDTTSLMKREAFPGFDETLLQHDDWDLYLNMASKGTRGHAVHGLEFFSFYMDEGITSINNKDCSDIIKSRYK